MLLRFAGLLVAGLVLPAAVQAQDRTYRDHAYRDGAYQEQAAPFGAPVPVRAGGRAPWSPDWAYDSGGDNDRRPELPAYQQGGGQQTGGPARNLLPDDGLHIVPR